MHMYIYTTYKRHRRMFQPSSMQGVERNMICSFRRSTTGKNKKTFRINMNQQHILSGSCTSSWPLHDIRVYKFPIVLFSMEKHVKCDGTNHVPGVKSLEESLGCILPRQNHCLLFTELDLVVLADESTLRLR